MRIRAEGAASVKEGWTTYPYRNKTKLSKARESFCGLMDWKIAPTSEGDAKKRLE